MRSVPPEVIARLLFHPFAEPKSDLAMASVYVCCSPRFAQLIDFWYIWADASGRKYIDVALQMTGYIHLTQLNHNQNEDIGHD